MADPLRAGADEWVPERPSLQGVRDALPRCRGCELFEDATQAVPGEGLARSRVVLLGEQPGDREDREGRPFVGPAGKLLDRALEDAGIARDDAYVTNVVKHFRWKAGRGKQRLHQSPARAHVTACRPWLSAEFATVGPEGVVLLGATAGKAVYGTSFRVGDARGALADWPESFPVAHPPAWVLATTHPSAVLRADDADRDEVYAGLVSDLRVAAQALG